MIRERRQSLFYGIYRLLTATTWLKKTRYTWPAIKTFFLIFLFFFWTFPSLIFSCLTTYLSYRCLTIESIEMAIIVDAREKLVLFLRKNFEIISRLFLWSIYHNFCKKNKLLRCIIAEKYYGNCAWPHILSVLLKIIKIIKFCAIFYCQYWLPKNVQFTIAVIFFLCKRI